MTARGAAPLRIEDTYSAPYWLDIEVNANATLADLDAFLREV